MPKAINFIVKPMLFGKGDFNEISFEDFSQEQMLRFQVIHRAEASDHQEVFIDIHSCDLVVGRIFENHLGLRLDINDDNECFLRDLRVLICLEFWRFSNIIASDDY